MLLLFAGNVFFADRPLGYLRPLAATCRRIFASGFLLAIYFGLVGLAVSSLTSRRAFALGGCRRCC